jgi:hypothetical protein
LQLGWWRLGVVALQIKRLAKTFSRAAGLAQCEGSLECGTGRFGIADS